MFNLQPSPERMKAFYEDLKGRLPDYGRKPNELKILPAIMPFVGQTAAEAQEKRRVHNELVTSAVGLATLSGHANYDFSKHDPAEILSSVEASGTQGNLQNVIRLAQEKQIDLSSIGRLYAESVMVPQITGTADEVAGYMARIFSEGGSDGFVISPAFLPHSFEDFVQHVVPRLKDMGVFQRDYAGFHLRDNLLGD